MLLDKLKYIILLSQCCVHFCSGSYTDNFFGDIFFKQESLAPRAARNIKSYAEASPLVETNKRKKGVDAQERFPKRRKGDSSCTLPAIDGATAQVRGWSYGNLPKRDATRFSRAVGFINYVLMFIVKCICWSRQFLCSLNCVVKFLFFPSVCVFFMVKSRLDQLFDCVDIRTINLLFSLIQVKKFGNDSQIGLISAEVGGAVEAAPTDAQVELFDSLIDGCREAVKGEVVDPKVCILVHNVLLRIEQ